MNEFNTKNTDSTRAQKIQKQYLSREDNKIDQLKRLDSKVKAPGKIVASLIGVVGALTMGGGMSLVMVSQNMAYGLALSIPGMIAALLAFPVYKLITSGRKKKYAESIFKLANELLNN